MITSNMTVMTFSDNSWNHGQLHYSLQGINIGNIGQFFIARLDLNGYSEMLTKDSAWSTLNEHSK